MARKVYKNVRIDPATGELDYFFPLEITDPSIRESARTYGLEIGQARLGFRKFEAVFIPCKDTAFIKGQQIYIDTPSEIQRQRYLDYIRDELAAQDAIKQDGRCQIPDGHGGTKRCPCRIANPAFVPGRDELKTIPVRCEGCIYEPFRQAHTTITVSCLDHENDDGKMESYEIAAPVSYYAADQYLKMSREFVAFIKERKPKLAPLAELLVDEYTKSESARELGKATSTIGSQTEKLKELVTEFLDNIITL